RRTGHRQYPICYHLLQGPFSSAVGILTLELTIRLFYSRRDYSKTVPFGPGPTMEVPWGTVNFKTFKLEKSSTTIKMPRRVDDELLKGVFEDFFPDFLRFFYPSADKVFDLGKGIE